LATSQQHSTIYDGALECSRANLFFMEISLILIMINFYFL